MPFKELDDAVTKTNSSAMITLFDRYMDAASRDIHTQIPAKILSVDYQKALVTVQPQIKTRVSKANEIEVPYLPVVEVPILFDDADNASARFTMPVQEGDTGVLEFCQRDTKIFLDSDGSHVTNAGDFVGVGFGGDAPVLGFRAGMRTKSEGKPLLKDRVNLQYGKSHLQITKGGDALLQTRSASVTVMDSGDVIASNANGNFKLLANGTINLNGVTISPEGVITLPDGVVLNTHTHDAGAYIAPDGPVSGVSGSPTKP